MPEETELPIREFADRGVLWLLESPENLRDLVRIVAEEIANKLDFTRAERLNRSLVPDDLHKQEADLLYRVPFREGTGEVWVYILLEHQSKPDRAMGLRLLSYMVQLWEAQRRSWEDAKVPSTKRRLHPIVPIVFYTGKRRWASPLNLTSLMDVPPMLARFVPQFETLFLKLRETPPEVLTRSGSAVAWAFRVLQAAEESQETLTAALSEAMAGLQALPEEAKAEWHRALHYFLLLILHKRAVDEQESLFAVVSESLEQPEEIEETKMTGAQALLAQGRKEGRKEGRLEGREEGREEGRQEGQEEGRRELLLEQMEFQFGPLSEEVIAAVRALEGSQLKAVARRVLTAKSLAELEL